MNETFHQTLMGAVQDRLRAILGNEEKLVEAWVAQHGFKPDECEIVRQDMYDGTTHMWVEKRGEFEELHKLRAKLKRYEEREPIVQRLMDTWTGSMKLDEVTIKKLSSGFRALLDFERPAPKTDWDKILK